MSEKPNKKPASFNWVEARSLCSLGQMFQQLRLDIDQDVAAMNHLIKDRKELRFRVASNNSNIAVMLEGAYIETISVVFSLVNDRILVKDGQTNAETFQMSIGLNDEGDCTFNVSDREYDSWQIRRKALERLFFTPTTLRP